MKDTLEQAVALDTYIDSLAKDPNAVPPSSLDRESATLVRDLDQLEKGIATGTIEEVRERTWQKVFATAKNETELDTPGELLYLFPTTRRKPHLAMVGLGLVASLAIGVVVLSVLLAVLSNNPDSEAIPQGYVTAIPRPTPNLTPLPSIEAKTGRTTAFDGEVLQVAYSPDGKYLAVVTPQKLYLQDRNGQTVKTLTRPVKVAQVEGPYVEGRIIPPENFTRLDSFVKIAWSPDSQSLATLNKDETGKNTAIRSWFINDITDRDFVQAPSPVTDIGWKPDGQRLLTLSQDKGLRFWDLSGKMLINRSTGDGIFALSPDGKNIAISHKDGRFGYYDAVKLEAGIKMIEAFRFESTFVPNSPPFSIITSLAWSADSKFLAIGNKWGLALLQQIGSYIATSGDPLGGVTGLAWSPNAYYLAGGSESNQLFLWHITGPSIQAFAPLTRHVGPINSVSWSPDGKTLATGSADHSVVEWTVPEKD